MERRRGVSGRPRYASGAPEESPTALQDAKKGRPQTSGNAPRRPKSTGSRAQERKSRAFYAKLVREARLKQFCVDFLRCLALSRNSKTLFRTAPAGKNRGLAHRAARRLARTMQSRKTSKFDPKIDPQSSKMASRGVSGALFGRLLSLEVTRSSDSERLGATRAARRATRGDQVGRSGSVGVGRSARSRAPLRHPSSALILIRLGINGIE